MQLHNLIIREERPEDQEVIRDVNRRAFAREEEAVLIDRLRIDKLVVASLVAAATVAAAGLLVDQVTVCPVITLPF